MQIRTILLITLILALPFKAAQPIPLNVPDKDYDLQLFGKAYGNYISAKNIKVKNIEVKKIKVVDYSNAIKSVRISYYIKNKNYVDLGTELTGIIPQDKIEALIRYEGGTIPAKLNPQNFFIGLGECDSLDKVKLAISKNGIDCVFVPVYTINEKELLEMVREIEKTDKQMIIALDFEHEDVDLLQLILKLAGKTNMAGEPVIHSIITLWGLQNPVMKQPLQYAECVENAVKYVAYIKSQAPSIYTYKTMCILYNQEKMELWKKAMENVQTDGYAFWGRHYEDGYLGMFKVEGDSAILSGFFGLSDGKWLPRQFSDSDVTYMQKRLPEIINQVKNEGWAGIILQGIENWDKVLE